MKNNENKEPNKKMNIKKNSNIPENKRDKMKKTKIKIEEIKNENKKNSKRKTKNLIKNKINSNYLPIIELSHSDKSKKLKNSNKTKLKKNLYNKFNKINNKVVKSSGDNKTNLKLKTKSELSKRVNKYNDTQMNLFSYQESIQLDKRSYSVYYFSLVKTKNLLIFSFCYNKDYNSRIIKINLFFFNFAVNYAVNALFFSDSTMHKIYEGAGKFNFIYQIPIILYSTFVSSGFIIILKLLALSENNVLKFKNSKGNQLNKNYESELNSIKYKFMFFFIINFLLLFIFWYYLGCFCAVYKNTRIHLLKDTLISFSTSLLYPFVLYFLPGIFRINSLKNKKQKGECMYKFSKVIQLFV